MASFCELVDGDGKQARESSRFHPLKIVFGEKMEEYPLGILAHVACSSLTPVKKASADLGRKLVELTR